MKFVKSLMLGCTLGLFGSVVSAADQADINQSIEELAQVVPGLQLKVNLERTFSRAIISEEAGVATLTLDPQFLQQLSPVGLTFVIAHEYAHVHLHHHKALSDLAMQISGIDEPDAAFDALETYPVKMGPLHAMNRNHELEADKVAAVWLRQMNINPCTDDVLTSIDNGGLVFTIVPSHPGFHERRTVICPKNFNSRSAGWTPPSQFGGGSMR